MVWYERYKMRNYEMRYHAADIGEAQSEPNLISLPCRNEESMKWDGKWYEEWDVDTRGQITSYITGKISFGDITGMD